MIVIKSRKNFCYIKVPDTIRNLVRDMDEIFLDLKSELVCIRSSSGRIRLLYSALKNEYGIAFTFDYRYANLGSLDLEIKEIERVLRAWNGVCYTVDDLKIRRSKNIKILNDKYILQDGNGFDFMGVDLVRVMIKYKFRFFVKSRVGKRWIYLPVDKVDDWFNNVFMRRGIYVDFKGKEITLERVNAVVEALSKRYKEDFENERVEVLDRMVRERLVA